jgi:hypothetical protein
MLRFIGMSTIGIAIGLYLLTGESMQQRIMRTRSFIISPFHQAQTEAPNTPPVVMSEETPSTPPSGSGCAPFRYTVRLHNVNDVASVSVGGLLIAKARWGYRGVQPLGAWRRIGLRPGDSDWIDLTPHLKAGKNLVSFQLWEKYGFGHSSVSIVLKWDETVIFSEAVDTRSGHQGTVYEKTITIILNDCTTTAIPG